MRDPHSDIPALHAFVEEAFGIAEDELTSATSLRDDDHFGFMALCFAYKQLTQSDLNNSLSAADAKYRKAR